jgi:hypothetical protein
MNVSRSATEYNLSTLVGYLDNKNLVTGFVNHFVNWFKNTTKHTPYSIVLKKPPSFGVTVSPRLDVSDTEEVAYRLA